MATWNPSSDGVVTLIDILGKSRVADESIQKQLLQQLQHFAETIPDYVCYLSHLLSNSTTADVTIRQVAGLILKSALSTTLRPVVPTLPVHFLSFLTSSLLNSLKDPLEIIRDTSASCISSLLPILGFWTDLYPTLSLRIRCQDTYEACLGSLLAVRRIAEDHTSLLVTVLDNNLTTCLLSFINCRDVKLQTLALETIKYLISTSPISVYLRSNLQNLVKIIVELLKNSDLEVRKQSVSILNSLISTAPMYLEHVISTVISSLITLIDCDHDTVAREACDIIEHLARLPDLSEVPLSLNLSLLIPALLKRIPYTDWDQSNVESRHSETINIPDNEAILANEIVHGNVSGETSDEGFYTVRHAACNCLDMISVLFRGDILQYFFPVVNHFLIDSDWVKKEAAVMAVGVVVIGCHDEMRQYLQTMISFLIDLVGGSNYPFPLRVMSSWTLSRFVPLIISSTKNLDEISVIFHIYLKLLSSDVKELRRAGATGLAEFVKHISTQNVPNFLMKFLELTVDSSLQVVGQGVAVKPKSTIFHLWTVISTALWAPGLTDDFRHVIVSKLSSFLMGQLDSCSSLVYCVCICDAFSQVILGSENSVQIFESKLFTLVEKYINFVLNSANSGQELVISTENCLVTFFFLLSSLIRSSSEQFFYGNLKTFLTLSLASLNVLLKSTYDVYSARASVFAFLGDLFSILDNLIDQSNPQLIEILTNFSSCSELDPLLEHAHKSINLIAELIAKNSSDDIGSMLSASLNADYFISHLLLFFKKTAQKSSSHVISQNLSNLIVSKIPQLINSYSIYFGSGLDPIDRQHAVLVFGRIIELFPIYILSLNPGIIINWISDFGCINIVEEVVGIQDVVIGLIAFLSQLSSTQLNQEQSILLCTFCFKTMSSLVKIASASSRYRSKIIGEIENISRNCKFDTNFSQKLIKLLG
ncbi:hypothetical protein RCL1_000460 [Eukaryota sp. TZLM3-RCL]